jgi:hypothetical protein
MTFLEHISVQVGLTKKFGSFNRGENIEEESVGAFFFASSVTSMTKT